jgi:hypothetical protein
VPFALRYRALTLISGFSHRALFALLSPFNAGFSIDIAANFSAPSGLARDSGRKDSRSGKFQLTILLSRQECQGMPLSPISVLGKTELALNHVLGLEPVP